MKRFILILCGVCTEGLETTICNCTIPIRQEHLRSETPCSQRNANYAVWTDRQDGLKVRASVCSRWEKINHITTNIFFQKVVVPEKRAIDTTQDECTLMAKTKRCDEMPMKFADGKWLYVPEPSEEGSWLRTVTSQILNCMVEEIALLHGICRIFQSTPS